MTARLRWWIVPVVLAVFLAAFVGFQQLEEMGEPGSGKEDGLFTQKAGASGPAVTIEASFAGGLTSHPSNHHLVVNNRDDSGELADWAEDWSLPAGAEVRPQLNGPYGTELYVLDIVEACRGGGGGASVKVGVRAPNGGGDIAWVAYVHLGEVRVQKGQPVYKDTVIGLIGDGFPYNENCWTGPHLHLEGYNEHEFSCYVDYAVGHRVQPGAPLGRVGGSDVAGPKQACP